ncbi:MAG: glycine cleavage T C-terminal barrel domain-containing protein [Pseudomonadota bacterium]
MKEKEDGPERKLVAFTVEATDADVIGDEPVWHDGEVVGWITSGGYAHNSQKSVAIGYIPAKLLEDGANGTYEIDVLGDRRPAALQMEPLFDPEAKCMRT